MKIKVGRKYSNKKVSREFTFEGSIIKKGNIRRRYNQEKPKKGHYRGKSTGTKGYIEGRWPNGHLVSTKGPQAS